MSSERIKYQDWIVELGHDPDSFPSEMGQYSPDRLFDSIEELASVFLIYKNQETEDELQLRVIKAVREALAQLDETEREFVVLYHFMGRSYREIADDSGRSICRLESLHKRALKRLKSILAGFVSKEFGLLREKIKACPICNSPNRDELDKLISSKKEIDTWRETIRLFRENHNIVIKTPQTLIGHLKFHGLDEKKEKKE